jgi:hypothetical protein
MVRTYGLFCWRYENTTQPSTPFHFQLPQNDSFLANILEIIDNHLGDELFGVEALCSPSAFQQIWICRQHDGKLIFCRFCTIAVSEIFTYSPFYCYPYRCITATFVPEFLTYKLNIMKKLVLTILVTAFSATMAMASDPTDSPGQELQ